MRPAVLFLLLAAAAPARTSIDSALLKAGDDFIRAHCPTRYSFLVVHHGQIVFERYYHGMAHDRYADVMSISKSVLSLLIGQAIDRGRIPSLDGKLADYYPEYFSPSIDPRKRQITLRHLIQMTAGFQWNEASSGAAWTASRDWHKHIIHLPLAAEPGKVFQYNTGLSHLLAGVLARATGQSPRAFAIENLFRPLGITKFRWETDPRGNYVGGFRMCFTARDLARFGSLALHGGNWRGRQLVSKAWIEESTARHIPQAGPDTIGDYGYHWWTRAQSGYATFMAAGYGGQYIFVVPALDLVVVTTAEPSSDPIERHRDAFTLLTKYVLPAVRRE